MNLLLLQRIMKKVILILSSAILLALIAAAVTAWSIMLKPNVKTVSQTRFYIHTGAGFRDVIDSLSSHDLIKNKKSFLLTARLKHFDTHIRPGSYVLKKGMGNNSIINLLRSGRQTPVKVTFNDVRTIADLAGRIGGQIEADSAGIYAFLTNPVNYSDDGFTRDNIMTVFIPDTYELYWTSSPGDFYRRMLREFKAYWTPERVEKAKVINMTPVEVSILASIIDDEVVKNEEKPKIAGVYLNRLRIGMPLQACPTIKFALNDFTIRRVLDEYLTVDSPYNTYKHTGLPPGPVRCASKSGLNAVLNAEKHDYLYFAAKSDFSGTHYFSRTLSEHNKHAAEYHMELNKKKIYR
jgi:UPF0755 protein